MGNSVELQRYSGTCVKSNLGERQSASLFQSCGDPCYSLGKGGNNIPRFHSGCGELPLHRTEPERQLECLGPCTITNAIKHARWDVSARLKPWPKQGVASLTVNKQILPWEHLGRLRIIFSRWFCGFLCTAPLAAGFRWKEIARELWLLSDLYQV